MLHLYNNSYLLRAVFGASESQSVTLKPLVFKTGTVSRNPLSLSERAIGLLLDVGEVKCSWIFDIGYWVFNARKFRI